MRSTLRPLVSQIDRTLAMVRIGASATSAGRVVLLGRGVFYLLVITLLSAFWDLVAAERLPATLVTLLPAGGLAVYVGVTEWITLSIPSIHLRLEDDIRSGAIEAHLLRPAYYPLMRIAESCGGLLVRQGTLGVIGVAGLVLSEHAGPSPLIWPCLGVLGVLGGLVGILLFALVGMCAFWVRRTVPIYLCVQKLSFLLGGLFAPLTLYPAWLQGIAEASPFAAQLYWPAAIVTAPGIATISQALTMELLWVAILAALLALVWQAGLRRLLRQCV
jgi:viologen exporter family transport system permease protein